MGQLAVVEKEKGREGASFSKARQTYNAIVHGTTREADAYLDRFADFNVQKLREKTNKKIEAILLDIDGCIAPAYDEIFPENIAKIQELIAAGVKVAVYSNCKDMPRLQVLKDMGVRIYSGKLEKPSREGFEAVCAEFGFNPETTWMVGDDPNTDGGAVGVLEGMAFIKAIPDNKEVVKREKKRTAMFVKGKLRDWAIESTLKNNDKILRSRDLRGRLAFS